MGFIGGEFTPLRGARREVGNVARALELSDEGGPQFGIGFSGDEHGVLGHDFFDKEFGSSNSHRKNPTPIAGTRRSKFQLHPAIGKY